MLIKSLIKSTKRPSINNYKNYIRYPTRLHSIEPIQGVEIGIPLNIFSNIFTNLHYGMDVTNFQIVLLQFLIGYYTYGKDRYNDAIYAKENNIEIKEKKKQLYEDINNNKNVYNTSINFSLFFIIFLLLNDENYLQNLPFIALLLSTEFYKEIKTNIGEVKPLYIGIMWTFSTLILPCVLIDNNYSILNSPLDYIPEILILFATSNLADIDDYEEDKHNNIGTIPVKYGKKNALGVTLFSLAIASLLFGLNPNYTNRPFINSIFELQNALLAYVSYNNLKDNV
tara:strand:- start:665 stop:1513 length:849 start_codon:yes stop_codon:yes gene_type:complete